MQIAFQIVAHLSYTAIVTFQNILVLREISHLLLKVIDGAVQVVGAISKHILSLVAACLVVQDHNDHVSVNFLSILCHLL